MHTYIHIRIYVYTYIYICIFLHTGTCAYVNMFVHTFTDVNVDAYILGLTPTCNVEFPASRHTARVPAGSGACKFGRFAEVRI